MDDARRRSDDVMGVVARERGASLCAYAYLLTGDLRDAEDLVQDALVKTFVRGRHVEIDSAEGYVRTAILTTWIDAYRRRRQWDRVRHLLVRGDRHDGPAEVVGTRHDVQAALRMLSPQQRACVVLRYYDDLTVGEIADRLGLADGTVKRYLSVAVGRLEGLLGPLAAPATDQTVLINGGDGR
ncbi:sigma-70 family RNA polymerase sigma factor [Cellulomonas fimi]|uniref:sigma-70 family RNA polymerase sigma factor n=1 Tax=Cellulomonas fimi TaxID=1708 RepID=UPI00234D4F85|nr:sigma-70 family RNA polymerase sigma factor [Cellulomonas fimi]MDC7120861.1 sigma-70 family RNA polymerase sigma factor [Cellulomonas fimi]